MTSYQKKLALGEGRFVLQNRFVLLRFLVIFLGLNCVVFFSNHVNAEYASTLDGKIDFYSVLDSLVERFATDLSSSNLRIQKLSQYKINLQGDIQPKFRDILRDRIDQALIEKVSIKSIKCMSCFRTLVTTDANDLIVQQGVQKNEELQSLSHSLGTRYFLESTFHYTPHEIVLSVAIFDAIKGEVIWSDKYSSLDPERQLLSQDSVTKRPSDSVNILAKYRLAVSPGFFLLPGFENHVNYPSVSFSLLEYMGGFIDHFGIILSGFTEPLSDSSNKDILLNAGGLLELKLLMNLGGEKFRKYITVGGGPLLTNNYQSFVLGPGFLLDIGKKFGISANINYLFPSDAMLSSEKIQLIGNQIQFSSDKQSKKVSGFCLDIAFNINMRW
ncbi:MAG: hypothetical protein HYS98_03210 [Deltaproteobacteria bacterium]|nr:hypothetical protein [Deltaproteobacteria bacterium]